MTKKKKKVMNLLFTVGADDFCEVPVNLSNTIAFTDNLL